jgi:glyoxylase-like metal-dependent hydrolase (beta-lactamase superfamily II)
MRLFCIAALSVNTVVALVAQQTPTTRALTEARPDVVKVDGIEILHVQKNIYMLVGGGANVTVQIGDEGVVLVDSGSPGQTDRIVAAIRHLTQKPLRYLINTSGDREHAGGNLQMVEAAGGLGRAFAAAEGRPQSVGIWTLSSENAANRLRAGSPGFPPMEDLGVPASTFFGRENDFYGNGEAIVLLHEPKAHTDGDVLVFFRGSDVVSTGDIFRTDGYPVIDRAKGGTYQGVLDALNVVLRIAVPERNEMGGTRIVPGHGFICNEYEVAEYRDMLTILRDRVRNMVNERMTLAQVKAARPTLEYDGFYGRRAEMTGDQLIDILYDELTTTKQ